MTNLQEGVKPASDQARTALLLGLPIGAGLLLAGLVVLGGVWQPWSKIRQDQIRLDELRAMEQRLPLLRQQQLQQLADAEKVKAQQTGLLQLIAGSGGISTVLAQLNREASAAGVQLNLFEPSAGAAGAITDPKAAKGAKPAPPPAAGAEAEPPPPKDPLESQGLTKSTTLLSARGRFPNLLDFQRRLERLGLLVVQSDLNLTTDEVKPDTPPPLTELKLNLSLYTKEPVAAPKTAAAAPGAPAQTAP
jgi:type IV pilus assembly protein PilO